MIEVKKQLVAKVVGESLGVASEADSGEFDLVQSDVSLVQGRILLDYSDSGDGKSTRAHSFARHYFISTGLPVVLVAAEDSSKTVFQDLIDAGIVVPIFLTDPKTPISTYERIVEGELPLLGQHEEKKTTKKVDGKDVEVITKKQKWASREENAGKYSAYIFEGLSTICENILDNLRENGRFPREQSDSFVEGGRTFMAASQTSFGFTQSEGIKLLKTSGMLPVQRVLWSAHESKGTESMDGSLIRGPKLVGSAATDTVRKFVGVLLHTERVNGEIRCYFDNHADQLSPKIMWKAKVTVNPFFAKELKKRYPAGYFVPKLPSGEDYLTSKDGLIEFLELEAETRSKGSLGAAQLAASIRKVQ